MPAGEKNDMTVKMIMGCALAIAGFCIYSHARMYAAPPAPQPSPADLEAAQQKVTAHVAQAAQTIPAHTMCLPLRQMHDPASGAIP